MSAPAPELEVLLPLFVQGRPGIASEFHRVARPLLTKFANRFGWFLAPDQREEIVQQAFLLLLGAAGKKFNPGRSSAAVFLRLIARRASREVGATYAPPGTRTRPPKRSGSAAQTSFVAGVVPLEDMLEHEAPTVEGPHPIVERQHDVAAILAAAPADVAGALYRIHMEDVPVTLVAAEMSMSRYALGRAIDKFAETFAA